MNSTFLAAKKFWIFFLSSFLLVSYAFASPNVSVIKTPSWVIPVTPGGKPASAKDFSDGYYILFSDKQVHLEKKSSFYRVIRQVVTESGIQNGSEISVVFDPTYEHVDFHDVTIWRDGKALNQLKAGNFKIMPLETDRQRFIYDGKYSASLILEDIRKGDKIEYAYTVTGWNTIFQNKYSGVFNFGAYDYIAHRHYAIIADKGRSLSFKDFNKPPAKKIDINGNASTYQWDLKNIKSYSEEDYTPSWFQDYPFVQVTEYKSWKEVVDWGIQFYQPPVLSNRLKVKSEEWKKQAKGSEYAYIGFAARFVQDEIRYLGIETGENSHRPHNPDEVFDQRYGDCKDKAFLLCALLRANNIEANPLLVNTYKRSYLSEYLPTHADFNHVVVHIAIGEVKKSFLLIDATASLQGGEASQISFPDFGEGLLLKKGQNDVIPLMLQKPGNMTITEEIILPYHTDTTGKGALSTKTVYFDSEADLIRGQFQQNNFSETEKNYLNYYRDTYKYASFETLDSLEFYDQREANNISLIERYSMKNGWQYDSTRQKYYFRLVGKVLYDQLINLPNRPRKNPVSLPYPYRMDYTIRAVLPERREVSIEDWEIKRPAYEIHFSSKYITAENVWELHYVYETLKDHVEASESAQFRKDMEKLKDNLEYELTTTDTTFSTSEDINFPMIILSLIVLAGSIWYCLRLYKFSPVLERNFSSELNLGGWIAVLGIGLVFQPVNILSTFLDNADIVYHTGAGWNALQGQSEIKNFSFHILLALEAFLNLFLATCSVTLIVLYAKKRDSFPLLFSIFISVFTVFIIFDLVLARWLLTPDASVSSDTVSTIIKQIIYAAIWIPYLNKSERVKRTFVTRYEGKTVVRKKVDSEAF